MYEGRRLHDWAQTANLMALLANCNRDPAKKRTPFSLADFLPPDLRKHCVAQRTGGIRLTRDNLRMLKPLFEKK